MAKLVSVARLPQHTGAYTALLTFAVTVKNILWIYKGQFDTAKSTFEILRTGQAWMMEQIPWHHGVNKKIREQLICQITATLLTNCF